SPFNVTLGQDLNGDSIFNDRPTSAQLQTALASANVAHNVALNCNETNASSIVPVNCGTGPARFSLNLRLSKAFGFGKKNETAGNAQGGGPMAGGTFGRPGGGGRGGRGGPFGGDNSGQKYSLTFAISSRNIFNNVNAGNPVGVISSPIFGQENSLAGGPFGSGSYNRRVDLQMTFSF